MEKEDIVLLNHLLSNMRKLIDRLDEAYKKQDFEAFSKIKRELSTLQQKVSEIL